jgi:hypothetical protein
MKTRNLLCRFSSFAVLVIVLLSLCSSLSLQAQEGIPTATAGFDAGMPGFRYSTFLPLVRFSVHDISGAPTKTPRPTPVPPITPRPTTTPTRTPAPTDTPEPAPTHTPEPTPTNTPPPSPTPKEPPTATPTQTPEPTPTNTPIPPSPTPTEEPTATPTQTPEPTPTNTPIPPSPTPAIVNEVFPIGFMLAAYASEVDGVAAGGFNIVHPFAGGWATLTDCQNYLAHADAHGLLVIMDLLPCKAHGGGEWDEQACADYISTLSTYDNLVAWYLPDEIDDFELAADLYEWVDEYDPQHHPVYGNPGTFNFEIIQRFLAFTDFLWGAWYPEYYRQPRAIVTYGTKLDAAACQDTDTKWGAIVQFFNFGNRGYPDAHEIRCDSYQAIIAGGTGLWYYTYRDGIELDDGAVYAELQRIADEIIGAGGLDEVILSPDVPQTITKAVVLGPNQSPLVAGQTYDSIQTLQKEHEGTYLFAVNIGADAVVVEFGNLPATEVEVLFEGRMIAVSDGSFRDSFGTDDVHIYRWQ